MEEWRDVPGYERLYKVSSLGRVRGMISGRILRDRISRLGYNSVMLYIDGTPKPVYVHRIVCSAFHGPVPKDRPHVLHGDNNPLNNTPDNLRWGSHQENMLDKRKHGTNFQANKTHCPRGHAYQGDNVMMSRGSRICRTCTNDRKREARKRNKEEKHDCK